MSPIEAPDTTCHHPQRAHNLSLECLLDYVPRAAARVLDCTGEWGRRGHQLKARGVREVFALVDATAGEPGPDEGYDKVIQGPLDFVELPDPRFDCIICSAALERLRNPEAFLPSLLKLLAPGGLFIATVPNMQYHKIVCALSEGHWSYGEGGVWGRKNLRFYTAHELRWLMNRAGVAQCKLASLVADDSAAFPRDEAGYVRAGRLHIGPLPDDLYPAWLTEYYLVLAVKPA